MNPSRDCREILLFARRVSVAAAIVATLAAQGTAPAFGGGLTAPRILTPFNPGAPACTQPPGLAPILAFAQDNSRDFMNGVGRGLAAAAADRGLSFRAELADNDPARQSAQMRDLLAARAAGVIVAPVDAVAVAPDSEAIIAAGGYVATVVPPPATTILNAPQYLTGKTLAEDASAYIRERLDGRAKVVLLTQDSLEFLAARFVAIRDELSKLPGVEIVADISPNPVNKEGGFATMRTILEAHPDVDMVLGADTVVLGALAALREAGRARADQYLGGIDGEPEAVAEIRRGDGPYKASIALASPIFGYALGVFAADWREGKSVPQAMDILPIALTAENLASYEADLAEPAAVYQEPARRDSYLKMYGNICYDTRDQYLNFPWSSE